MKDPFSKPFERVQDRQRQTDGPFFHIHCNDGENIADEPDSKLLKVRKGTVLPHLMPMQEWSGLMDDLINDGFRSQS